MGTSWAVLRDSSEQKIFIVLGGNHRAAIAYALGLKNLRVRMLPRDYLSAQTVRYRDISHDPMSRLVFDNIVSERFLGWRGVHRE